LFYEFQGVTTSLLSEREMKCPICLQVRSGAFQMLTGVLFPVAAGPFVSLMVHFQWAKFYSDSSAQKKFKIYLLSQTASAIKTGLYIPKIHKNPKALLEFVKEIYHPIKSKLFTIAAFQLIAAMGITYAQQNFYYSKLRPLIEGKHTFHDYKNSFE